MKNQSIALDLKAWRRKAGLTQADLAHLLGIERARVCDFEKGRLLPAADHLVVLSLVYGKPADMLISGLLDGAIDALISRLRSLPRVLDPEEEPGFNRAHTLSELARRLEVIANQSI